MILRESFRSCPRVMAKVSRHRGGCARSSHPLLGQMLLLNSHTSAVPVVFGMNHTSFPCSVLVKAEFTEGSPLRSLSMSSTEPEVLAEHVPHDLEPRSQSPSNSFFLRGNSLLPSGPGTQEGEDV